jgi:hypothetical protein
MIPFVGSGSAFTKGNQIEDNMKDLKNISTEALQKEIERRQKIEKVPRKQDNIVWDSVVQSALDRRDRVASGEYHEDNDDAYYMFEEVMTAVFGKDYFKWENEQTA